MKCITKLAAIMLMASSALLAPSANAEEHDSAQLARALSGVTMPLQDGLKASSAKGQPISAKYELEDGALQLSVYTVENGKFYEVIVDHRAGTVVKLEELKKPGDIDAAKKQIAAMTNAKSSLATAADKAVEANAGFRAISVTPELKAGRAIAEVTLLNGTTFKTVQQQME
jgi:uncharacterized membrane protein YkoI